MVETTHVMRRVGVVIDTAEESGCCIFANVLSEKMPSTRMVIHEPAHVVDESTDENERP